ncbi:MAG: FKBP-type peptidyl-prolyl cis-trans isomerase [Lentimicrobiaceae bacterium]|nr:FKBP-type peptidyl-prolyl cis-trans isomerase [Lentimicrobiaceae bacterium]
MTLKKLNLALLSMTVAVMLFSCSKHPGFKKTSDGLYYKFHVKSDDTTTLKRGMILEILISYSINDSVLFNSAEIPDKFLIPLDSSAYKGDLYDALAMMVPGDSATFISSADSFFIKTLRMPEVPDSAFVNKDVVFNIKMISAMTREQMDAQRQKELAEIKLQDQSAFDEFLNRKNINTQPLESGVYYIEEIKGSANKPKPGDMATIHFIVSTVGGDTLYSSYAQQRPMTWEVGKIFDNQGATEALNLMSKGTKAMVIVPSELAFGEQGRGQMIAPHTSLVYEFEMVGVQSKAAYEAEQEAIRKKADDEKNKAMLGETKERDSYLQKHNITVKPTASGLYYIEKQAGTGKKAGSGKTVKVHYTGTLLNGQKFDSSYDRNEPIEFVLGQGQVIAGWDEGIAMMKEGGKATLIIPSKIAYGPQGRMPTIPPYSTLVFDVELIEVK